MDEHALHAYLREVGTQATFAYNALRGLDNAIARIDDVDQAGATTLRAEVFRSIHSCLTHTSNVSRLLWPPPPRLKKGESQQELEARTPRLARANALRAALRLPDAGHPLESRTMRNHLEHFDERLDHWHSNSARRNIMQDYVGPFNAVGGLDIGDRMRSYDPTTGRLHFRDEEFDLVAIAQALEDLVKRVSEALSSAAS
jgi:hypothetical protein